MNKIYPLIAAMVVSLSILVVPSKTLAKALNGAEISALIKGKNVALKTRFGTFPLRYRTDGVVVGDGTKLGLAKIFAPKESGKWWVRGAALPAMANLV